MLERYMRERGLDLNKVQASLDQIATTINDLRKGNKVHYSPALYQANELLGVQYGRIRIA